MKDASFVSYVPLLSLPPSVLRYGAHSEWPVRYQDGSEPFLLLFRVLNDERPFWSPSLEQVRTDIYNRWSTIVRIVSRTS